MLDLKDRRAFPAAKALVLKGHRVRRVQLAPKAPELRDRKALKGGKDRKVLKERRGAKEQGLKARKDHRGQQVVPGLAFKDLKVFKERKVHPAARASDLKVRRAHKDHPAAKAVGAKGLKVHKASPAVRASALRDHKARRACPA